MFVQDGILTLHTVLVYASQYVWLKPIYSSFFLNFWCLEKMNCKRKIIRSSNKFCFLLCIHYMLFIQRDIVYVCLRRKQNFTYSYLHKHSYTSMYQTSVVFYFKRLKVRGVSRFCTFSFSPGNC